MFTKSIEKAIENVLKNSDNSLKLRKDIEGLTDEKRKLKDELADLKKQLVALKEERMKLEIAQKEAALERNFQKKELELRQKNYDDLTKRIEKAGEDMKDIYKEEWGPVCSHSNK